MSKARRSTRKPRAAKKSAKLAKSVVKKPGAKAVEARLEIPGFLIAADSIVPCRSCGAAEGEPCRMAPLDKGVPLQPGHVHFGRRIRRLLLTAKAPELRDQLEAKAVAVVIEGLMRAKRKEAS